MHHDDSRASKANPSAEVVNHQYVVLLPFRAQCDVGGSKRRRWTFTDKANLNLINRRYLTHSRWPHLGVAVIRYCSWMHTM